MAEKTEYQHFILERGGIQVKITLSCPIMAVDYERRMREEMERHGISNKEGREWAIAKAWTDFKEEC